MAGLVAAIHAAPFPADRKRSGFLNDVDDRDEILWGGRGFDILGCQTMERAIPMTEFFGCQPPPRPPSITIARWLWRWN